MKTFIKSIAFFALALAFVLPQPASADDYGYSTYDYGSYSTYDYDYGYSSYDYGSSYSTYDYDYGYDTYDYGYDYSTYDYDYDYSTYDYGSYSTYDYDYGYDTYDYDYAYSTYDYDYGYSTYDYDYGYSTYDYDYDQSYVTYDYDDYDVTYSGGYDYYDDGGYYYDYDDYGYYDYDDGYYYGGSNCGSNCYSNPPCRTNCNPPKPEPKDLDVICIPSDRTIEAGDTVTFEAEVIGGTAPYTYRWSGDISSSNRTVRVRFDDEGTYRVVIKVTDKKGRTATDECDVRVEEEEDDEDFDAICVPAKTTVDKGDRVTFKARVSGGDRPYDYDWSGDADGDDDEITVRFNREGTYEIDLKVTDDEGRVARDTCEVRVRDDDDDDDRDVNVTTGTITHNPPTVGSVYLNQVPYTGPEDVAKGAAFVGILLTWSIAGAMILKKRKTKAEVSNRIAAFKEANRAAQA